MIRVSQQAVTSEFLFCYLPLVIHGLQDELIVFRGNELTRIVGHELYIPFGSESIFGFDNDCDAIHAGAQMLLVGLCNDRDEGDLVVAVVVGHVFIQ